MWLPSLLSACGEAVNPATTVTGLQVVAIGTDPAQPAPFQDLTIDVWVADGLGTGADVVVWMCSPVDGRCLEFDALPGSDGLPLRFVAEAGPADPVFRATVGWPFLVDVALDAAAGSGAPFDADIGVAGEGILVWALACVPGVCDVIRQVRADPVAGSPTWWDATAALSDPAALLEGVPPGEASVAVKFVPLWRGPEFGTDSTHTDPNLPPSLGLLARTVEPPTAWLSFFDPDGDDLSIQAFTTVGGVVLQRPGPNEARLAVIPSLGHLRAHPQALTWDGGGGDWFVVVEDGRGGTAVWSSTAARQDRCAPEITLPAGPTPGGLLEVGGYGASVSPRFVGFPNGADVQVSLSARDGSATWTGFATVGGGGTTSSGGPYAAPRDPCAPTPLWVDLFSYQPIEVCELAGEPMDLRVVAGDREGRQATLAFPVVATQPPELTCF